jgi:hypothetical protein
MPATILGHTNISPQGGRWTHPYSTTRRYLHNVQRVQTLVEEM